MDRTVQNMVRRCTSLAQLRSSPNALPASSIRKLFVDYFCESNNHEYIKSSPVYLLSDHSLAFVNAGMNQFRDVFLQQIEPPSPRVANYQKCIRIFGKHNDLSQVGNDTTHQTFFEMLGNWSFNDYFKRDACNMAWEFLTEVCKLPRERLYVTYFGGDEKLDIPPDNEVKEIWREIGVKENCILPFGVKDNFWEAKSTGPCGPCTEIHYDHVPGRTDAGALVNTGSNELTELWNLVFIQYNRKSQEELVKLKKHYVDTGMGFERLVAVLQGKISNYDTDLFYPLFDAIKKITRHSGYTGMFDGNPVDGGYRILADHTRMIAVALSDGMLPNHHQKVRHIIRKAIGVSNNVFNTEKSIISELTNYVAETLSDAYPEIGNNLSKIQYIIQNEEKTFKTKIIKCKSQWQKETKDYPQLNNIDITKTPNLLSGFIYLKKELLSKRATEIDKDQAWNILEAFGVPIESLEEVAKLLGLKFDRKSFEDYVLLQKNKFKVEQEEKLKKQVLNPETISELEDKNLKPTVDYFKYDCMSFYSGSYKFKKQPSSILGIVCRDKLVDRISPSDVQDGEQIGFILDRTQFFSREYNQDCDSGSFVVENSKKERVNFQVAEVAKVRGLAVHFGKFEKFNGTIAVGDAGVLQLNSSKRIKIMANHTALHILNAGIRKILQVCEEKYSNVTSDFIEFHFMWYNKKLNRQSIEEVENFVGDFIRKRVPVKRKILNLHDFYEEEDVLVLPGYHPLTLDVPVVEINSGVHLSKEYCKGTHVLNTGDIKDFVITYFNIGQYGASLIRGVTGENALRIRENDKKMETKLTNLINEISETSESKDEFVRKLNNFEISINEGLNNTEVSYITSENMREKIRVLKKDLKNQKMEQAGYFQKKSCPRT